MELRCICPCHSCSILQRAAMYAGVSVVDVIEAAVACDCCRPHHCSALLSKWLANEPERETPIPSLYKDSGEGAE